MKTIPGFEKYKIDEDGNIFSTIRNKYLKPDLSGDGYPRYTLSNNSITKRIFAHRIVADLYVPNPENKSFVNHKDGNKQNNNYNNLEWVTTSENNHHAYAIGLKTQNGEANHRHKYKECTIDVMHKLKKFGLSIDEISVHMQIDKAYIRRVLNGNRWRHVWIKYN